MTLAEQVHVVRRYQRAIRIDTDLGDVAALKGFVCPQSSADVLETMARHALETGQGAFTWTGPYGGGKSSLAVVLGTMLNGSGNLRSEAQVILGKGVSSLLLDAFPPRSRGWRVLPVTGRRDRPAQVIGEAITAAGLLKGDSIPSTWSEKEILNALEEISMRHPRAGGGLAVFIDELGKFLEGAARDGTDIHLFQQLAEMASRSGGRLLIIGILHQAFEEYAHRLSRETRDEWAKIQGRFVDLLINTDSNEQIDLLARAIENDGQGEQIQALAEGIASLIQGNTPPPDFAAMLAACWPLHPVTTCLLGPLSRRRFGQNQRSLFGFLNSAEPGGFRDFLSTASASDLYAPDRLWDYLRVNLEPSILVSPDGHRWALAADALGRCEAHGGTGLHMRLLKVIALADLLKERSRLPASRALLELALPDDRKAAIRDALKDLQRWSLVVFRKFSDAWAIFEGSDFDIDLAVEEASQNAAGTTEQILEQLMPFRPMVAKHHYHATGALRWFDVDVAPLASLEETVRTYEPRHGAIGCFLLAIPTEGESLSKAAGLCREAARHDGKWDIVIGLSPNAWSIPSLAVEFATLEHVSEDHPELQGDRVARTELMARIGAVREQLEGDLARAFDSASWYRNGESRSLKFTRSGLNVLASELADDRFSDAPVLHNELLGRTKPSSSAAAARNALLRRMVLNEDEERLGIGGFPAEGGLYVSLLKKTKLHKKTREGWRFVSPARREKDSCCLKPLWAVARKLLKKNSDRAIQVADLFEVWRSAPYGVKDGFLPVLAVAFLLSERGNLAFYRQGVFQTGLSDLDVDLLVSDSADIQARWMDLSGISRDLLSELANVVRELDPANALSCLDPLDVARGLVVIHDQLPPWVGRTQRLSRNAVRIRQLFKNAKDPNRLIFDDLPRVNSGTGKGGETTALEIAHALREALVELRQAYPAMLARLRENLLSELHVPSAAPAMMEELRSRAANIRELGGDHRLEAFIMRIASFEGSDEDIEGLAGMAVNKPIHTWVDSDVDKAMVELADMAQRFVRVEAFAHVKGRKDTRHAMAVVVGMAGRPVPLQREFDVSGREQRSVESLAKAVDSTLRGSGEERHNVVLAALAEVSARYLEDGRGSSTVVPRKRKHRA